MSRSAPIDAERLYCVLDAVRNGSADAIVELDVDGVIREWNPAAARVLGSSATLVLGKPLSQFLEAEYLTTWEALLAGIKAGQPANRSAVVLRRQDGLPVHASLSLAPILTASGHVAGSCVVIQDHTERRLAQETLAAGEERVRRSEALAGVGSFVLDAAAESVQWSDGMYRIFAITPGTFEGTREAHLALVHPEDRRAVAAALDAPVHHGRATELDHRALSDGRTFWIFLATEPVADEQGRVIGVRGVCQDISARKHAEASVRSALDLAERANDELRALDALKDEFLATVSHELRTPLTSIIGFSRVLTTVAPELTSYVEPIARSGADMARMIEKLLDYSRLQAGHISLQPENVDLASEVDRYLALYAEPSSQRHHNEVPAGLQLVTDPSALERVLGNLIGNASRYGGNTCSIRVTASVDASGSTVISVADDGPGIPVEHQARLFERFYQVPGAASRRGTGIGLAIVREYVTRQGGEVWCESAAGHGATFFVRMPPKRSRKDDDPRAAS